MKFLRLFGSTSQRDAVLASIDYKILQKTEGVPGVGVIQGTWVDPRYTPFYIEDISGSTNTVQIKKNNDSAPTLTIEKSTDGTSWETIGTTSTTAITATIPANSKLYLRCSATQWANSGIYYNYFNSASGNFNIGGNINSLLYGSSFNGQTEFQSGVGTYTFGKLFISNTHIISAEQLLLPATTLADDCYSCMFFDCTSLTTAPVLPATTLARGCYQNMFYGCTSLVTAPALPATTMAPACYSNMFSGCTSLTTSPALPATTLAQSCYDAMFQNCTSLTTSPALPATTLAYGCYNYMFTGCTSLTTAPELPATTLVNDCYNQMFYDCTNLNYIKCLATDISVSYCTNDWVYGVAATGTFIKDPNMTGWTTGNNGIPSGWTVNGVFLSQALNVATIKMTDLDSGTGYYTINGGSHVSLAEGTTTIPITQSMNGQTLLVHGEFDGTVMEETLVLSWVDYTPTISIIESNNYVTITAPTADTIEYRLGSSGEYSAYTGPVCIAADTTIYVRATKTVSDVDYTSIASQAVTHVLIPPSNLTITCTNNFVTITATDAAMLEYNLDGGSNYTTYTEPFAITETVTVYAKATNSDGSITASQECEYVNQYASTPFYIEDISGSDNTIQIMKYGAAPTLTIEKSTDGTNWTTWGQTSTDAISATVPANGKLYLRCSATQWSSSSSDYNYFNSATGNFNVGGNINSLLYGSSFNGQTEFPSGVGTNTFRSLFNSNTRIISAEQLLLPATTLANFCYYGMFQKCTSLTTAPELPATTLAQGCYVNMFDGCTSLTSAPELPATTLANSCYSYMFDSCTSLTTAPVLPATTLANSCYQRMFQKCTSLTTAPELPATTLVQYCYSNMFNGCTNLNYIKCLATDISATSCTTSWIYNVAASGTFVKNRSMSSWTTGNNGIPSGWTVQNAA